MFDIFQQLRSSMGDFSPNPIIFQRFLHQIDEVFTTTTNFDQFLAVFGHPATIFKQIVTKSDHFLPISLRVDVSPFIIF